MFLSHSAENFRRRMLYCCINFGYRKSLEERGGGYQDFPSKIFCLTVPTKISAGESFIVASISGIEKVWRRGGGVSRFSVENFLSHSADENFRRRILYCCINFGNRKSLEKGGGGVSKISVKNFLSHSAENFRRGILQCCINFWRRGGGVSKVYVEMFLSHSAENFRRRMLYCCINFGYRKSLEERERGGGIKIFRRKCFVSQCRRKFPQANPLLLHQFRVSKKFGGEGGGVSRFSVENFLSHSADENFRRRILYCCINFGNRKSLEKGGEYQKFPSKIFCLTVPKISVGESFSVALIFGEEGGGGVSKVYVEMFLSHSAENFRRRMLYCCINFGYRKSLEERGGGYQDFPSKIFCLTVPTKISAGESFIVASISGIEKVWRRGGGVSRFSVENFLSHSADENFRRRILYCCINFGNRKSLEKGGEYQKFPSKIFCLTVPKISVGESFSVALIFGEEGGVSKVYVEMFLSHSAENFRRRMLYCCINFGYRKSLEERGGGGIKIFRRKFFVSQCRRKLPQANPLLLHQFRVSKKFGGEGGGVSRFSVENFLSHSADENFRRRILYCCINFGNRKSLEKGGGEYQKFPSKIFCLTVPKISVGESFSVALIFGEEGRGYQKFTSKCFCLTMPTKFSVVESFIVALILGIEKVWRRGGGYQDFRSKIFASKCRRNFP